MRTGVPKKLFGYALGALGGTLADAIIPERLRQPQAPPMVPVSDAMQVDLPGLRCDGAEFAVEWSFASVLVPDGAVFVMTVRDWALLDRGLDSWSKAELRRDDGQIVRALLRRRRPRK